VATYSAIFVPNKDLASFAVTSAASVSTAIGRKALFAINSDQDVHISFDNTTGAGTATSANFRLPADVIAEFDLSEYYDTINVFNNSGSTANVYILFLSRH